ncbi:MAG: pilus assembly protein PilM, partial [Firmicutes bacterium]|nr:pilus assembly protein PilM [Bacillota bacterium]
PVDEVTLDFEIIDRDMEEGEMEVILACAHNDIIRSHLEVLWEAGVQPLAIDIQPFAMMRGLGVEYSRPAESVAMLDIGAGSSDLVIAKAGTPYFTRFLPIGGNRLTELVAKYTGLARHEAEEAKETIGDALLDPEQFSMESREYQVNMGLREGLKDLALELRRSFDYYLLQHKEENISGLILSGGSALIKNLPTFLAREFDIKVRFGVYDERLRCPQALFERFHAQTPVYTVALGLAMREVTEE